RYEPQPDPIAEQIKQLEVRKLEAEVRKLESEAIRNQADAELKGANKDKTNLDYIEQETGTTHARNMQAQQAQAEGNQDLQVTKAILTPRKEGESSPNIPAAIGYNALTRQSA